MFWTWVQRLMTRPSTHSNSASAGSQPPEGRAIRREPEWPGLPPVQRVLHDALAPVAPLDAFTESLAAHHNPSFLSPLRHTVDPSASGGLVAGLAIATPGMAAHYSGPGQLIVPSAPKRSTAVQRQRTTWATHAEPTGEEPLTRTNEALGDLTGHQGIVPDAPTQEPVAHPVAPQRTLAVVPESAPRRSTLPSFIVRDLPIVATPSQLQRSHTDANPRTATEAQVLAQADEERVVGPPVAEPSAGQIDTTAPLSGFSAAISSLQDEHPGPASTAPSSPPPQHSGPSERDGQRVRVQRLASDPHGSRPDHSPQPAPAEPPTTSSPQSSSTVSVADGAPTHSPEHAFQRDRNTTGSVDALQDSGTAGTRHPPTPLASTVHVQRHVDSNADRQSDISAAPTSSSMPVIDSGSRTEQPAAPLESVGLLAKQPPVLAAPSQLQRLSEASGLDSISGLALSAQHTQQLAPVTSAPDAVMPDRSHASATNSPQAPPPPVQLQRHMDASAADEAPILGNAATPAPPVATRHWLTERVTAPSRTVGLLAERPPLVPAPAPTRSAAEPPPVQRVTHLPTAEAHTLPSPTIVVSDAHSPALNGTTDQSRPMLHGAVETPVMLQRAFPAFAVPFADSVRAAAPAPPKQLMDTVGPATSFASMFSAGVEDGQRAAEDGFTSVQLPHAGAENGVSLSTGASAPPAAPSSDASSPAPAVSADATPPNPVNASDQKEDLDEMARKLFEPLSARLRAELWLDRERAGLIADVRH